MHAIKYTTGRKYNGDQVLTIEYNRPTDADLFDMIPVHFTDDSRSISGVVQLMACQLDARYGVGADVLREYDAGRYTEI